MKRSDVEALFPVIAGLSTLAGEITRMVNWVRGRLSSGDSATLDELIREMQFWREDTLDDLQHQVAQIIAKKGEANEGEIDG